MAPEQAGCAGHPDLAGEFRDLGRAALDRLEPWLAQLREHAAAGAATAPDGRPAGADLGEAGTDGAAAPAAACALCPICAVITLLRGERSELAVRLSDHATGLVSVLRTALDEGSTAPTAAQAEGPSGSMAPQHGGRAAQHIAVVRADPPPG